MIKSFRKTFRKKSGKERGQVLVIVALVLTALIGLVGLAIDSGYLYVSYSRLRRATDAAALAATGEFKRTSPTSTIADIIAPMKAAAQQQLKMNDVVPKEDAAGAQMVKIETCFTNPTDTDLCLKLRTPPQDDAKIIRVTVTENVPTFFLAVVGIHSVSMTAVSISKAASVDVVLVLDSSESMTYDAQKEDAMRDPNTCNPHLCEPFETLKKSARKFADRVLFSPYDRMAVVHFDQRAHLDLAMTTDLGLIDDAIMGLTVTEGLGRCPYTQDDLAKAPYGNDPVLIPAPVPFASPGYTPYTKDPGGTCRLFNHDSGSDKKFQYMDCPMAYSPNPDPSQCGTTNIGEGIVYADNILLGQYTNMTVPPGPLPSKRDESLWVMVLLTDGSANAGYAEDTLHPPSIKPICPAYTWAYSWFDTGHLPQCNDSNPGVRHKDKTDSNYDADDYARDAFDELANKTGGAGALIFTIGMTGAVKANHGYGPIGESLLKYPTLPTDQGGLDDGAYAFTDGSSELNSIFLGIANKIATRISE